ncbi:MAG: saccharopine dehydrogenase, partial [Planctomycetota bacterium]
MVLGAGLVGSVIARDLSCDFDVLLVDRDEGALGRARERCPSLTVQRADVREPAAWLEQAKRADVVAGALSSELGYAALEALVEAGCAVVDIAFFDRDARALDARARATGARVVFDMGLAPGMSNILAVDAAGRLDEV